MLWEPKQNTCFFTLFMDFNFSLPCKVGRPTVFFTLIPAHESDTIQITKWIEV